MGEKVLVVEDDPGMQLALVTVLQKRGFEADRASSAEDALQKMAGTAYDLIILDIRLPGISGLEAIPLIKQRPEQGEIIVMTAHGSKATALDAVRKGAYDYFTKPFELREMEVVITRALEKRKLQSQIEELKERLDVDGPTRKLIGQSAGIKRVKAMIQKIAPLETTVLITGESGTGKELIADVIHALSRRATGPLVKINCAAIPETLLESELCGYEKGAFTGAVTLKPGKFEQAHNGTILMDEVGDMPLSLQAKLLRLVEQKQVERLGGQKSIPVDVRIVAATNQDLPVLIRDKKFREDLYYRLNVATIYLPPLRERKDDLPFLVQHFLGQINVRLGTAVSGICRDGMEVLFAHHWPGNVRELANLLERVVILSSGTILSGKEVRMAFQRSPEILPCAASVDSISLNETLEQVEKNLIIGALRKSMGKQSEAAKVLGLNPKNLWKKIRKHGIEKIMGFSNDESSGGSGA